MNATGNLDSEPVATTEAMREQMWRFSESIYDKDTATAKEIVRKGSKINVTYIEFNYKQLGKDDKWFVKLCGIVNNNKIKIKREIFLQRIRGSSQSPFEQDDLEAINNLKGSPKHEIYINKTQNFLIYETLNKNIPYIVGVDVATGKLNDNSAITVLNPYTLKVVAEYKNNVIAPPDLAVVVAKFVKKYIPRSIIAVESNHNGESVLHLLKKSVVGMNVYFDSNKYFIPETNDRLDQKGFEIQEAMRRKYYGVYTSTKTRDMMMSILFEHVLHHKAEFVGVYLIDDLNNLVRAASGKIAAAPGKHDDNIMSYLIALYVYYHGTNLARYGFVRGEKEPQKPVEKTMEDYYNELPEELQAMFPRMQTSEDYMRQAKEEMEKQRQLTRNRTVETNGMEVRVEQFEVSESLDEDLVDNERDQSEAEFYDFLNELNDD